MAEKYIKNAPLVCSKRLLLSVQLCFGIMHLYSLRFNITVVLECMVNQTAVSDEENDGHNHSIHINLTSAQLCEYASKQKEDIEVDFKPPMPHNFEDGEFLWSTDVQNIIRSSFHWGYIATQIPAGVMSRRYGGKRYFGWSMFFCGGLTIMIPVAARLGYTAVVIIRVLIGACQGFIWPAVMTIWSRWAPPLERQRLAGFSFAGLALGIIATYPLSTALCSSHAGGGWESMFFISGSLAVVWCFLWSVYGYDSPNEHPHISNEEKMYINAILKSTIPMSVEVEYSTPWRSIIESKPFWGIVAVNISSDISMYGMIMCIYSYMHEVLYFRPEEIGSMSALPYTGFFFVTIFSAFVFDFAMERQICSSTVARKIAVCTALMIPAVLISSVGFIGCNERDLAIVIFVTGISISGIEVGAGFSTNAMEIAPAHAGVMFAISNTIASISAMIFLPVIKYMTVESKQEQWHSVFFLLAAVNVVAAVAYVILGTGEIQEWAIVSVEDNDDSIAKSSTRTQTSH